MNVVTRRPSQRRAPQYHQSAAEGPAPARPVFSFEFFPPKPDQNPDDFWRVVGDLSALEPAFHSVTYGAGGSTRRETGAIAAGIQQRFGVPAAAHLTCVGAQRSAVDKVADEYWRAGIRHIVALRGDPTEGIGARYQPCVGGYDYADSLVAGLARLHPFEISVAAYPEMHPQARDKNDDLDHLKRKIDAGATRAITQFFFDMDAFERFLERCARAGIGLPIVPGILPINNFARLEIFAKACGASIPVALRNACVGLDADPLKRHRFAVDYAVAQCAALRAMGLNEFHFYTLNRAEMVRDICDGLGVAPAEERQIAINRE